MMATEQRGRITVPTRPPDARPTSKRGNGVVRANRLDERAAITIAAVSGVVAALAGAQPTGSGLVDPLLVGVAVAFVTWAAASAPWWAVAATAAIASIVAFDGVLTLVGALAFVVGLWIGVRRRDLGTVRAIVAAVALNVLVRSELVGFFGSSALIGIATGVVLFVVGIRRRRRRTRRVAWTAVAVVAIAAGIALIGFSLSASAARTRLLEGNRLAREGIAELGDGDFARAAARFGAAADAFSAADRDLKRPWAQPAALVPVLAQNSEAVSELAKRRGIEHPRDRAALEQLDPGGLRLTNGRIDLAAFDSFTDPLTSAQRTLAELRASVDDVDSPWLVAPLGRTDRGPRRRHRRQRAAARERDPRRPSSSPTCSGVTGPGATSSRSRRRPRPGDWAGSWATSPSSSPTRGSSR